MWPELPYGEWKDTLDTLHIWMEMAGKVKLEFAPFLNQWWEVAFVVNASGITTGAVPYRGKIFQIDFNFLKHALIIQTSWGKTEMLPLEPQYVVEFYQRFIGILKKLGIQANIWPVPVEMPHPIPFMKDTKHGTYRKEYVERWWQILVKVQVVFDRFRTSFNGKSSPVHFFWGSFDLNGTRFSGKKAVPPKATGVMRRIMRFAENEENYAFGFWPGDERFPHAAFYSYLYPKPPGTETIKFDDSASFNEQLGEYILRYDFVRKKSDPEKTLMRFLESTYNESAMLAKWDVGSFINEVPITH